jgi:hypothetical protein
MSEPDRHRDASSVPWRSDPPIIEPLLYRRERSPYISAKMSSQKKLSTVATWFIMGSPRRHDRCTRRSSLGEVLRACGLPRDGDGISACKWAKWVWLFDVAQQGTSSHTPALAGTALTGARDRPRLLEFRRFSDLLS